MASISFDVLNYQVLIGPEMARIEAMLEVKLSAVIECGGKSAGIWIAAVRPGAPVPPGRVWPDQRGVIFVAPGQYPWYLDLLRNEARVRCTLDLSRPRDHRLWSGDEPVGENETLAAPVPPPPVPNLDEWLDARPNIADAVIWNGTVYWAWDDELREALRDAFRAAVRREPYLDVDDPPDNVAFPIPEEFGFRQVLSSSDAVTLYLGYAAHSLALEATGRVPWSIAGWPHERLRLLLDGKHMFQSELDGFRIVWEQHGDVVPCHVSRAWRFLVESAMLRPTPLSTVAALIEWCRDNLAHMPGGATMSDYRDHWHYGGFAPVSRIIDGTEGPDGFRHWTTGCHGTSGFLRTVLRSANLPVQIVQPQGVSHSLPVFPAIGRFMTHGDDPYNQLTTSALPNVPPEELLVGTDRFEPLFGSAVPLASRRRNVGVRTAELALRHLPIALLRDHCDDLANGVARADGQVFASLQKLALTVEELETAALWERIEEKIDALGGCGNLPE